MATAKKPRRAKRGTPGRPPTPRALPGMEDRANQELEDIAHTYAEIRDQRIALLRDEVQLKQRAMTEMKQLKRTVYKRNGVEIALIAGAETIRVKVAPPPSDDDEADAGAPAADAGIEP